jgi:hypothetical protein
MCSIWQGFRPRRLSSAEMAGKISELCAIGAEKTVSASSWGPRASATEPILPDVSSANMRGSFGILSRPIAVYFQKARFQS